MRDAECEDEAIKRDGAALIDRGKKIARTGLAPAFELIELHFALLQREDVGRR